MLLSSNNIYQHSDLVLGKISDEYTDKWTIKRCEACAGAAWTVGLAVLTLDSVVKRAKTVQTHKRLTQLNMQVQTSLPA